MKKCLAAVCFLFMLSATLPAQSQPPIFNDGQKVVFFGDSITHGGWYYYYVQLFYATRFPERKLNLPNAGIAGATASGSLTRLDNDVLEQKPDQVYIMFGMNDVGRNNYKSAEADAKTIEARTRSLDNYRKAMAETVTRIKDKKVLPVLITPSPYDQYGSAPTAENLKVCNDGLAKCAAIAKEIAEQNACPLVDLHTSMTGLLIKHPELSICGKDRVHPGKSGHMVMAYYLLKAQQVPETVAGVVIDNAAKTVTSSDNCAISELSSSPGKLSFTYHPKALPFPVFPEYLEAANIVDWKQLNRETLKVVNLPGGEYRLSIEGQEIGTFSSGQFADGIELSDKKTPQAEQARQLFNAVVNKANADRPLRRIVQVESMFHKDRDKLSDPAAMDQLIAKKLETISPQYQKYYSGVFDGYRKDRDSIPQMREKSEAALAAIHKLQTTRPLKVELQAVK